MPRTRLSPDPTVRTSELQKCFEDFLTACGNRDLAYNLNHLTETVTWKAAPRTETMARYAAM